MHVCVFNFSGLCIIEHMCVHHDASPQLSHSFPAASRGWKRVKPQTSGAPQPIRIVCLASHGRLTEQEHTASHTALQGKPLLSPFPSFSTLLNTTDSILPLSTLCPSFSDVHHPSVRRSLSKMFQKSFGDNSDQVCVFRDAVIATHITASNPFLIYHTQMFT